MDIDFSEVTEYVQNIGLLNTGYVLLVDSNGQVIVDNERNTYCSGSVTSLGFWDKLNSYKGSENEYGINIFSEKINGENVGYRTKRVDGLIPFNKRSVIIM